MCIIGILSENRGEHYRGKSRMGGTRPGELVGKFKVGYTSYYDRIRSECC